MYYYDTDRVNKILSKQVYIVDNEYYFTFKDLRESLIEEIKRDTLENNEDKDIVKSNMELLEKIYNDNYGYNENFIIEELRAFGYTIIKIQDIIYNLLVLKDFWKSKKCSDIEDTETQKIEDLIKEIGNYFND